MPRQPLYPHVPKVNIKIDPSRRYKLQYLDGGEWKTWVPYPAPWEKNPFGEVIPGIVVTEGILVLSPRFPLRVIEIPEALPQSKAVT